MSTLVLQERHESIEGCLILTLNRGKQRNSLSRDMLSELGNAIDVASNDKTVKVVILQGDGPAFCSGHDLKELTSHRDDDDKGAEFYRETMQQCSLMMRKIVRCPKPVIAKVHGIATAAGCQLVASCDLAIAGESATFATPGVHLGLFCSTPMVGLSRNVSRKQSMEMLLLGEAVSAERAEQFGLINKTVADVDLDAAVDEWAAKLAAKPSYSVKVGIEGFYNQLEMNMNDAYDYVSEIMVENMLADDSIEGIGAFLQKRLPVWAKGS
jgi:enoyl-CoA hydratase/carnithine racemase